MTRSISFSRPITGSSFDSRAACVRLRPNWSRICEPPCGCCLVVRADLHLLLALVAGEELDDLLAHAVEVGAQLHEHLGGDALALADEAEEDVLGADVVVAELEGLAQRQLEHLLGARRERDVARGLLLALPDDVLHLLAHRVE